MTVKIKVTGKVQGVFFRGSTLKKAKSLGIKGYVMNKADGSVCMIATAEQERLMKLIHWCKTGVELAKVEHIDYEMIDPQQFSSFEIKR